MKRAFRLTAFFLALILLALALSSCGAPDPTKDFSNEYKPETDFQYNIEYSDTGFGEFAESEQGLYFLRQSFLYFYDYRSGEVLPLCKKPNCLHDRESNPYATAGCEALVNGEAMFLYNDALYIKTDEVVSKGENRTHQDVIKKYSLDGTLLEDFYVFPSIPQCYIRHRGYMYYTAENNEMIDGDLSSLMKYKLVQVNLDTKEERLLFLDDFMDGQLDRLSAYGKHLYFSRTGLRKNQDDFIEQIIVYDLGKDTYEIKESTAESGQISIPIIYNNAMLYTCWHYDFADERNKMIYLSDLDGTSERAWKESQKNNNRYLWDGTYFYLDNFPMVVNAHLESERVITVCNEQLEEVCTLDFNNVEGAEGIVFYPSFWSIHCTDSFVFILIEHNTVNSNVITGNEGDYLLVADKSQFASGTAHFRLVCRFAGE